MPKLIDRHGPRADTWINFNGDAGAVQPERDVILPLDVWREYKSQWLGRSGRIGVLLSPADDVAVLATDLDSLQLIAVSFPSFTDGRGYSQSRMLRERYAFKREIRAVGDVLIDQLFYLYKCGFDGFALRDDQDLGIALRAFRSFSDSYQATVDRPPLFRRRAGLAGFPDQPLVHRSVQASVQPDASDTLVQAA